MPSTSVPRGEHSALTLTWWKFLLVAIVYVAIIQLGGLLIGGGVDHDATFDKAGNLIRVALIPIAVSAVFAVGLATWLGWWPEIIHEKLRVQRWIWFIPITFLATAFVITDWANLFDVSFSLILNKLGGNQDAYPLALLAVVVQIIFGIVLLKRRRKIEPEPAT